MRGTGYNDVWWSKVRFDHSGAGFGRQHADSLQRLGCGRADCLVILG
jgi:hypothetical protein